ncbi:MATE family efflux transporter [Bacillus sp. ISL-40]|uniref:MATE family efflux transporter n=1 Tax=unclassified Bacillus (in: firmicutes) TaxID=185979 RepID=UPI001BEBEAF6|nr:MULTISPECIES: MATE family efflux transporter [unclassified Bacillus (in: firmicutes)]MBT2700636.1 MATE family efflux transporter [Bacillus sp. ISL-40]MBT2744094.1 MATE family efflux transporter [Bacillus sp. ISL-77]
MNKLELNIRHRTVSILDKYFTGESIDYKKIFAIILPLFVDQAFLILMSLLNTAMISSAGVAAVSAVSMVDSLNIFLANVFIAVATGGTVIVAQYKGSGNSAMVSKTATQAISACTIFSVLISALVIIFHTPILNMLFGKAEADVFQNARIYLIGSCLSYPLIAIFQAVTGALRGVGETKPCLNLSLIMNLTNTILNVLLITIFKMGVEGLVVSTILARVLGMVASLIYVLKYNETIRFRIKSAFRIDMSILKKVMFIGLPFAAEQIFFNGGKLLTQTFIVQLGTLSMTVYAIGNAIALLYQIGPNALGIAIVTIVGQCVGRRNIEDARKFIYSLIGLSSIFFVVADLILLPLFPLLIKLFNPPDEIVPTIFTLILISAIAQPILWSPSFIMPSALRAAGDSNFTSIASLLSMWLLRVVLGYILGITLGFGIIGVWVAMIVEWGARGIIFGWRFKGKKWYEHKLV